MNIEVLPSIRNQDEDKLKEQFSTDVLKGFTAKSKYISSKYFYDSRGSKLFSSITDSKDYYPTQCEYEIFQNNSGHYSELLKNEPFNLIELGAGDGRKTKLLLDRFLKDERKFHYIPVDISESAVEGLLKDLDETYPDLASTGVVGEYMDASRWILKNRKDRNVVLFLGSNIGNFNQEEAIVFLKVLWKNLNHDDLIIIGFDQKKDINTLNRAYNDSDGVTQQFNFNILNRMNTELGADFDCDKFMHYGFYNPSMGAMESFLISKVDQEVRIKDLEKTFYFKAYEPIHLEYSNKYLPGDIDFLAKEAGFKVDLNLFDSRLYYCSSLWRVAKENI